MGRVLLTVFTSLGIVFTGLGLAGLGGRPLVGALQGSLAVISLVTSVVGLVLLFLPSVNRWMSAVRRRAAPSRSGCARSSSPPTWRSRWAGWGW